MLGIYKQLIFNIPNNEKNRFLSTIIVFAFQPTIINLL